MVEASELSSFSCPRCAKAVEERFYGPCSECRDELVAGVSTVAKALEVTRFVPKMNVAPNQVATKD